MYNLKAKNKNFLNFFLDFKESLETISEKVLKTSNTLEKFYKYFFIIFIVSIYIIFKSYFVIGMGGDDGRFPLFYPDRYFDTIFENTRCASLDLEADCSNYTYTVFTLKSLAGLGFTYKDFYFLIFFLGFYFFYQSLKEINQYYKSNTPLSKYFMFFLSLLYPLNPLVLDQVWTNHWASIFTVIGTPLAFLLFVKLIFKTLKIIDIIIYNLIFTTLSLYFANVMQLVVTIIFFIVFSIIYLIFNFKDFKFFISRTLFFFLIFLATNFNWVFAFLFKRPETAYDVGDPMAAWINMKSSLEYYKTFNNFNFLFLNGVNPTNNYDIIYYIFLVLFGICIMISILYLIYFSILKIVKKESSDFFSLGLLSNFVIIGYLQSIALTSFGISLFLFLSKHIYILNGLRNYINKTPVIYTLIVLASIFITYIVISKKSKFFSIFFASVILFFSLISLRNFIKLEDYKFNLNEGYSRTTSFDSETEDLLKYLKSDKSILRTTYFPVSEGPWSIIINEDKKELYIGHSPIFALTGIDDLNGMFNIEGLGHLNKTFPNENFLEMDPEKIIFRLKFLGVNKIIINNSIHLTENKYMGYPKTDRYEIIYNYIKNNLKLDYETRNKFFSVYDLNNSKVQFKKYLYKPEEVYKLNFYSVNFDEASFTYSSLPDNNFNYKPSNIRESSIEDSNLNIFVDTFGNKTKMKNMNTVNVSQQQNQTEQYYVLNVKGNNVLRILINTPTNPFTINIAVDGKNEPCSNKIFSRNSTCKEFKDLKPQKINDTLVYTLESGSDSPEFMYVNIKNKKSKDLNTKDIIPQFYTADTNLIKYNPFSIQERQRYLDKYFVKNTSSLEYQVPKNFEMIRNDRNTYTVKAELNNKNLPLIIVFKDQFNTKWLLEGSNLKSQTKFNSDTVFNGWVIQPDENSEKLELTIKYIDHQNGEIYRSINYISISINILIVVTYLLYGTFKILIRKYRR